MRMRCVISSVTFTGGSSATFVSASFLKAVAELYDAMNGDAPQTRPYAIRQSQRGAFGGQNILNLANAGAITSFDSTSDFHDLTDTVSSHFNAANEFQRSHRATKSRRRILQSRAFSSETFSPDPDGCGGCVFVDAAGHSLTLNDVSFVGCSAVYGGGGFFNVSTFSANSGIASSNVARQGGGSFVFKWSFRIDERCMARNIFYSHDTAFIQGIPGLIVWIDASNTTHKCEQCMNRASQKA
jgi:hypothetical protein